MWRLGAEPPVWLRSGDPCEGSGPTQKTLKDGPEDRSVMADLLSEVGIGWKKGHDPEVLISLPGSCLLCALPVRHAMSPRLSQALCCELIFTLPVFSGMQGRAAEAASCTSF